MALTPEDIKQIRRIARLEAVAATPDHASVTFYPVRSFNRGTGRWAATGGSAGLNRGLDELDEMYGSDAFAE